MSATSPHDAINAFVDRLIEEKELHILEKDLVQEIRIDLVERAQDKVNMAIITNLPDDKLDAFNKLTRTGDLVALQKFCQEAIPNIEEVIAQSLL